MLRSVPAHSASFIASGMGTACGESAACMRSASCGVTIFSIFKCSMIFMASVLLIDVPMRW